MDTELQGQLDNLQVTSKLKTDNSTMLGETGKIVARIITIISMHFNGVLRYNVIYY